METLISTLDGKWIPCPAVDALGRAIESRYVLADTPARADRDFGDGGNGGIVALEQRMNVIRCTPRPAAWGLQIAHAISEHAVTRIILGLGGSATNDGGFRHGGGTGRAFHRGAVRDPADLTDQAGWISHSRIALPEIIAACDVDNPLLGPRGATAVFSAQKGATREDQIALGSRARAPGRGERWRSRRPNLPGAGAAGGLDSGCCISREPG